VLNVNCTNSLVAITARVCLCGCRHNELRADAKSEPSRRSPRYATVSAYSSAIAAALAEHSTSADWSSASVHVSDRRAGSLQYAARRHANHLQALRLRAYGAYRQGCEEPIVPARCRLVRAGYGIGLSSHEISMNEPGRCQAL
jgi:hypothetical protein